MFEELGTPGHILGSAASLGAVAASVVGWLPPLAAVIAVVWYCIQIYESDTVKNWKKQRMRKRLLSLHQQAGELELRLVDTTDDETLEHLKKAIAMRVDIDAGLQKRALAHERANAAMILEAEKRLTSTQPMSPEDD